MATTALEHVVELNEGAKAIRKYAFEVSLSALGAIVRSTRAGTNLRGFNEVASQMRDWSRDLELAVQQVTVLTAQRVSLVSNFVRRSRLVALLDKAGETPSAGGALSDCERRTREEIAGLRAELKRVGRTLEDAFEGIAQLGLMASVLSRAALIEAASGTESQRRELTIASQEFASYAESVNGAISQILSRYRTGSP